MKIIPSAGKILVKRLEASDATPGGIVLPEPVRKRPQEGKIISIGTGKILENGTAREVQVKEGDRVLLTNYSGAAIEVCGEEYLIMDESEILAVVE